MYNLPWYIFWGLWISGLLMGMFLGGVFTLDIITKARAKTHKEMQELTRKINNVSDHK